MSKNSENNKILLKNEIVKYKRLADNVFYEHREEARKTLKRLELLKNEKTIIQKNIRKRTL